MTTPITNCSWQDREDGTCNEPANQTPECHPAICPRIAHLRGSGQRYTVICSTNDGLDLYFSATGADDQEVREKCTKAALTRRLTKRVTGTSAWPERDPHLVYVVSKHPVTREERIRRDKERILFRINSLQVSRNYADEVEALQTTAEIERLHGLLGDLDQIPEDADFDGGPALACPEEDCQSLNVQPDTWQCQSCGFQGEAREFYAAEDPEDLLRQAGLDHKGRP